MFDLPAFGIPHIDTGCTREDDGQWVVVVRGILVLGVEGLVGGRSVEARLCSLERFGRGIEGAAVGSAVGGS